MTPGSQNINPVPTPRPASVAPFGNDDPKRRQRVLITSMAGVILVVALVLLFVFRPWHHPVPAVGGDPTKLSEFVGASDFKKMSFEKREVYMKMMNSKKEQITKAYDDGQISLETFQSSMLAAHMGKQLDDMRKYFAKPVGDDRLKYLDKVLAKKDVKEDAIKHNVGEKEEKKEQQMTKDAAAEKAEVDTWPPEVQDQYLQFETAMAERKKEHRASKQPVTRPAV